MSDAVEKPFTPVAQYVRMSTDMQEGSIENQSAAIAQYAEANCFKVIATYSDPGESGLLLINRPGLRRLLRDVTEGAPFKAILVYDVSRFGRFQNIDEAAHYEFLCKSAGVPIIYCAENFNSPSKPANTVLKSLKRYMAAEFSRELGERVLHAQRRLFDQGFARGGPCAYALRRVAIASDGSSRKILGLGERKSVPTDHVRWVLGPEQEIETVRFIFDCIVNAGMRCSQVADELNRRATPRPGGKPWNKNKVYKIVKNPQYAGYAIWQKSTIRLQGIRRTVPDVERVIREDTIPAIVDQVTFEKAQASLKQRQRHWTEQNSTAAFEEFLRSHSTLSRKDLGRCNALPSEYVIRRDWGSLLQVVHTLGGKVGGSVNRLQYHNARKKITKALLDGFPDRLRLIPSPSGGASALMLDRKLRIRLLFFHPVARKSLTRAWRFKRPADRNSYLYLCCFWNCEFENVEAMYLTKEFPSKSVEQVLRERSAWFDSAARLENLDQFCTVSATIIG